MEGCFFAAPRDGGRVILEGLAGGGVGYLPTGVGGATQVLLIVTEA